MAVSLAYEISLEPNSVANCAIKIRHRHFIFNASQQLSWKYRTEREMAASSEPVPERDPGSLNQPASILDNFSSYCERLKDGLRNDQEAFMKQLDNKFHDGDISLQQLAILQSIRNDQETFMKQLNSTFRDGYISQQQLTVLESIRDRISAPRSHRTNAHLIWGAILQAMAVAIGVLFGVFTILAYKANETANSQSLAANQLALLGLCLSNPALVRNSMYLKRHRM